MHYFKLKYISLIKQQSLSFFEFVNNIYTINRSINIMINFFQFLTWYCIFYAIVLSTSKQACRQNPLKELVLSLKPTLSEIYSHFLINICFGIGMRKYMFQNFWNLYFLSSPVQGRTKRKQYLLFRNSLSLCNDRGQGHFSWRKILFPEKDLV